MNGISVCFISFGSLGGQWIRVDRHTVDSFFDQRFVRFRVDGQFFQFIERVETVNYATCKLEEKHVSLNVSFGCSQPLTESLTHQTSCISNPNVVALHT